MYLFQETADGGWVCFFGMRTQEYDSRCPAPNRGLAYLAYIDSVKISGLPRELRTPVFQTMLLSYAQWLRDRGFARLCYWACPPRAGALYLFPTRAEKQKTHDSVQKLLNWYKDIWELGKREGIIHDYQNAHEAVS